MDRTKAVWLALIGAAFLFFLARLAMSPRTRGDVAWTLGSWTHPADVEGRRLQD